MRAPHPRNSCGNPWNWNANFPSPRAHTQAICATLVVLDDDKERAPYTPLLQPMMGALSEGLQANREYEVVEVLRVLEDVAQLATDFFRPHLVS